jgi:iron complex transport system substrate-binding protein
MAAGSKGLVARVLPRTAILTAVLLAFLAAVVGAQSRSAGARRIVSLVPALTEALFAIGAGPQVVGVSSFDEFPPDVKTRPRVGALLDPDIERIFTLRPDLVMVYGSQSDLQSQLSRAGIRAFSYRHGGIQTTVDTIRRLGAATAHESEAEGLISSLQRRLDAVRARVKGRARPRTLLVVERQPGTLREVYASGGVGFLHEMLEIAGGRNVFADAARESVQPSVEMLLTSAPDVILEVRATALTESRAAAEREAWTSLASVPAVRQQRVHLLSGDYLVVPGPRLAEAAEAFARTLHPDAFK